MPSTVFSNKKKKIIFIIYQPLIRFPNVKNKCNRKILFYSVDGGWGIELKNLDSNYTNHISFFFFLENPDF